jgi:hypothetical protein
MKAIGALRRPELSLVFALRDCQRLRDVSDDIVRMLDADGEADIARRHTRGELLFGAELLVGGRGWMDCQRTGVADVSDVIEQLQCIDEALSGLNASFELEAYQGSVSTLEIGLGAAAVLVGLEARENDMAHEGESGESVRDLDWILIVLSKAEWQGFEALQKLERIERREQPPRHPARASPWREECKQSAPTAWRPQSKSHHDRLRPAGSAAESARRVPPRENCRYALF